MKTKCDLYGCCESFSRVQNLANASKKGFALYVVTNSNTNVQTRIGVTYKQSAGDSGILVNYCPFCGYHLHKWFAAAVKAGVVQGGRAEHVSG